MAMTEARAAAAAWRYALGFNEMRVLKLMVEIGVPEILERNGGPMTLSELSSATSCPEAALYRIMRFLSHRGIFKQQITTTTLAAVTYGPTLISCNLTLDKLGMFMLMQSGPDIDISAEDLKAGRGSGLDPASTDDKLWSPEIDGECRRGLDDMLDSHSRVTASALVENVPETFQQIDSLVDIGGRAGTTIGLLVKAFPWIRGTNFDLPGVISRAPPVDGVVHVGGDMFKAVPKADAIMLVVCMTMIYVI